MPRAKVRVGLLCAVLGWAMPLLALAEPVPSGTSAADVQQLASQVESLRARTRDLEAQLNALTATTDRLTKLHEQDAQIRVKVDELQKELAETRRLEKARQREAEAAARRFEAGYENGLFFRVGMFRLTLNGQAQVRYVGEIDQGRDKASTFNVRSAALKTTFDVGRWVTGLLELDFGSTYIPAAPFAQPESMLREAYIDVKPLKWLTIRGGRFRAPLGRQRLTDRMNLAEPERNLTTLAFTNAQDLGLLLAAAPWDGRLLVEAAVTNGESPWAVIQDRNGNLDLRYTVRVVGSPLGALPLVEGDWRGRAPARFSLGVAASYDLVPDPQPRANGNYENVEVITTAAEAAVNWRRLSLQAEYFYRHERYGGSLPTQSFQGASLQLQVVLLPRWLMLALHGAYAEPHTLGMTAVVPGLQITSGLDSGTLPRTYTMVDSQVPMHAWETGGTVVVFGQSPNLKMQLSYAWRRSLMGWGDLDTHLIMVQLCAGF